MKDAARSISTREGDALVVVDVQNDFLPGGALAVTNGDNVVPVLNRYIAHFSARGLPVFATRDWHTEDHCSFHLHGGLWPVHCVAKSPGAAFAEDLRLPRGTPVIDKADRRDKEAFSGFEGTDLEQRLREAAVNRLYIGGLATDYCVKCTVLAALRLGFTTVVLRDAIRPVDLHLGDGARALRDMHEKGALLITLEDLVQQPPES